MKQTFLIYGTFYSSKHFFIEYIQQRQQGQQFYTVTQHSVDVLPEPVDVFRGIWGLKMSCQDPQLLEPGAIQTWTATKPRKSGLTFQARSSEIHTMDSCLAQWYQPSCNAPCGCDCSRKPGKWHLTLDNSFLGREI